MKHVLRLILPLLIASNLCGLARSESLSLTGDWGYQDTNSATDQQSENYSVDFVKHINLTEAMSLSTTVNFNRSKQETVTRENISPSISYLVTNDLFVLNLSGTAGEEFNSKNSENSSKALAVNWASAWKKDKWIPYVGLNYNQSWSEDDQEVKAINTESSSSGLNLAWDFFPSKLFYTYNINESHNKVTEGKSQSDTHFARFNTERSFLDEKISVSFSQQYNTTTSKNRLAVSSGVAMLPIATSGFGQERNPPGGNYSLPTLPGLTDGDTTDSVVTTVDDAALMQIAFRTNYQTVTTLYLYTDAVLPIATYSAFSWDLYSSAGNLTWTLEQSGLTATYNTTYGRFEIDVSGYSRNFLSVVAVSDAGATLVTFSEIELYQEIAATGSTTLVQSRSENHSTNVNLNFQLKPDLRLSSNFSYNLNESSTSVSANSTDVNSSLSWNPTNDLAVRLNGGVTSSSAGNSLEDQTRTYGLSVSFPPLPTVDSSWGVTLTETYEGTHHLTSGYNYSMQLVADIYEDLTARFNGSFAQNDNIQENSIDSTTSSQINFTARLVPGLVAGISSNYSKTSGQQCTIDGGGNIHWRLSEMLSITANYAHAWASTDTSSMGLGFNVALTRNMQVSFSHNRSISPESTHTTSMDWKWTISQYISMLTSGSYQNGQGSESWNVTGRLNARFSVM
nr:hypothetical protein [Desulfobulbaceae bacterium]